MLNSSYSFKHLQNLIDNDITLKYIKLKIIFNLYHLLPCCLKKNLQKKKTKQTKQNRIKPIDEQAEEKELEKSMADIHTHEL